MNYKTENIPDRWDPEPRWHTLIAVGAIGGLYAALPSSLIVSPRWLYLAVVAALLILTVISHIGNYRKLNRVFGFTVNGVVTLVMVISVGLLIRALPEHKELRRSCLSPPLHFGLQTSLFLLCGTGGLTRKVRTGATGNWVTRTTLFFFRR